MRLIIKHGFAVWDLSITAGARCAKHSTSGSIIRDCIHWILERCGAD